MKKTVRIVALVAVAALSSCANYDKKDPFFITFHMEGSSVEGQNMVIPEHVGYPPKIKYFRISPEISHKQVAAFYPFKSEDGTSNGAVLVLNQAGQRRLLNITTMNDGKILLAKVDFKTVDYLRIDGPVQDGILMISQGISDEVLALFQDEEVNWVKLQDPPFGQTAPETQEEMLQSY